MAPALGSVEDVLSTAKIDSISTMVPLGLSAATEELRRYEEAMKDEIEMLFSDSANEKTKLVIDTVSGFYEELFNLAKGKGANDRQLNQINNFIESGMTSLVHEFSGYFDDEVKDFIAFFSLFETRKNEAVWCEVFTFYFNPRMLNAVPSELASEFIKRFWDCYLFDRTEGKPSPYYFGRLDKILYDQIYGLQSMDSDGTKHYDTDYIRFFERHSRSIAEQGSPERRSKILRTLKERN
jgi:hypothetical protein